MPSPRPSAVPFDFNPAAGRALTTAQHVATTVPDALNGDAEMYKLSKRLWSIEVHRRLEILTRRALEA